MDKLFSQRRQIDHLHKSAVALLEQLIEIPSLSKQEDQTAALLCKVLGEAGIPHQRAGNNVWALNQFFEEGKPTLLLNSHHDTVKPNPQYTNPPFQAIQQEGKLFGLGSNDAGGSLVALLAAFVFFYDQENLPFNLIWSGTAEEEISGAQGIESILPLLPPIDYAIVGEPTLLQLAIAEKGLLVIDATVEGVPGHAAREEGVNALYKALDDLNWIRNFSFPKLSDTLGPVKMTATVLETENKAHNVVPALVKYTLDVRVTDAYTHEEILDILQENLQAALHPRSMRMRATRIDPSHPLVLAGSALGKEMYGSPTCSDKALMPFSALKCGPGDSARSHSANEYIYLNEIEEGINFYIQIIQNHSS